MWDLGPQPRIEPRPYALGPQHVSHWTIREVPISLSLVTTKTAVTVALSAFVEHLLVPGHTLYQVLFLCYINAIPGASGSELSFLGLQPVPLTTTCVLSHLGWTALVVVYTSGASFRWSWNLPLNPGYLTCCVVTKSCPTVSGAHGLWPARLLCPWGFSRQENCSVLPCLSPGDLPNPGIESTSPALASGFFTAESLGEGW